VSIADLTRPFAETHQPIFDDQAPNGSGSRHCMDRLTHIVSVCEAMQAALERPLRVLDLGCGQGFFSYGLSARGALVHGIDHRAANISVCRALAEERGDLTISFDTARIEDVVPSLEADCYDLVLGIGVFRHIVHENGPTYLRAMLRDLGDKVAAGLFEFALAEEPSDGAVVQPKSRRHLLADLAFVHEVAKLDAGSSTIPRPLYFASNRCWYLNGKACVFTEWTSVSNDAAPDVHQGTRRFYFARDVFAKQFLLNDPTHSVSNREEWSREVHFLKNPPPHFTAPTLHLHGQNDTEAWLVRDLLPGETLDRRVAAGDGAYDAGGIIRDVLRQLATLERANLHHNDVRTWNVLIDQHGGATLIDFGAITRRSEDCTWPKNIFLSFLIFMRAVIDVKREHYTPIRRIWFDPDRLPEPYRRAIWMMLSSAPGEWSFSRLLKEIEQRGVSSATGDNNAYNMFHALLEAAESAFQTYDEYVADLAASLAASEARANCLHARILGVEQALAASSAREQALAANRLVEHEAPAAASWPLAALSRAAHWAAQPFARLRSRTD
jgi:O-antigen chain-terminating bifunctional methyltransferase/kinase